MATQTISLNRGDSPNLGFRLQGGIDFAQPLVIQKVNAGSPADRAGLKSGDAVIKINNTDVYNLRHKEAQDVIIKAGSAFSITIQRGGSTWRPQVTPTGNLHSASPNSPVTRTSLAAKPQQSIDAIGTGHNVAAKPFLNGAVNGGPKLVNKQYNSPIGIYSEQSIAETITKQSEVLSTGAVGVNFKKNEKNYDATKSAVYSMLQEAEKEPNYSEPVTRGDLHSRQSRCYSVNERSDSRLSNYSTRNNCNYEPEITRCSDCERVIVGVFVRIKDKNLHVECFKCSTCGASLKNVGYYNINNKLYCDVHAKLAAKANPPGPNLVPVTIPPGGKAPASAISSALATHSLPSPGPISPKLGAGPISPSQNITAAPFQNYTNTPKPFSSVAAPLSPNSYSRPLPKTPYQAPPAPAPVLPASPIIAPAAPAFAPKPAGGSSAKGRQAGGNVFAPKRGRGVLNVGGLGARIAQCAACHSQIRGPFITALGKIWCPEHFVCATAQCRRPLQDIGFVEEQGQLHCEYCFEQYLAPNCAKCGSKVKGDCLKAIQKNFHPECFSCAHCGKLFGNNPFFLEDGLPYCEADWNEMFTTKCFACGFPVEAGDRWVEALNNNYHTQCFNCTSCKKNLEGQSFYAKGGRPFCKNHAR